MLQLNEKLEIMKANMKPMLMKKQTLRIEMNIILTLMNNEKPFNNINLELKCIEPCVKANEI